MRRFSLDSGTGRSSLRTGYEPWILGFARYVVAVAFLTCFANSTYAQQSSLTRSVATRTEQRVALVIGNAAYPEGPLRNPVNDAQDISRALTELGFRVVLLTDASRRQMIQAVQEFGKQIKGGGVGLFYYAGHGTQSRGRNYLLPVGVPIRAHVDLLVEAVDVTIVHEQMEEAGNPVNILVLDACRNNPFARSIGSSGRGLGQMDATKGTFIAFATAPGQTSDDGKGRNSLYTKYLLESLRQPDTDIDKVFRRVTAEVSRATGGMQVPWVSSSLTKDFSFRAAVTSAASPNTPTQDPAAIERTFWESIKDGRNAAELTSYLDQYPNGYFAGIARARLKVLAEERERVAEEQRKRQETETRALLEQRRWEEDQRRIAAEQRQLEQSPQQPPPTKKVGDVCFMNGNTYPRRIIVKSRNSNFKTELLIGQAQYGQRNSGCIHELGIGIYSCEVYTTYTRTMIENFEIKITEGRLNYNLAVNYYN